MNNIVKGVVMNNKYLLLYKEYMLNNMYHLTNSNNITPANVCTLCCYDCNGSCISGNSNKYKLIKMFKYVNANAQTNALTLPSPNALTVVKPYVMSSILCSKLCSENVHNDCICL
jgi:hypothetical protein